MNVDILWQNFLEKIKNIVKMEKSDIIRHNKPFYIDKCGTEREQVYYENRIC